MSWHPPIRSNGFRLSDVRLRTRMAVLLVVVSLLPLALSAYVGIRQSRAWLLDSTYSLLGAGAERAVHELDEFNLGRLQAATRIASFPETMSYCRADASRRAAMQTSVTGLLATFPAKDTTIAGVALLDRRGRVLAATNPAVIGIDLSFRPYVQAALQGRVNQSDIYLTVAQGGEAPSIAYAAPMQGADSAVDCVALLLVNAQAIWQRIRASNALAGQGSFAVLFDSQGIRIAHSYNDDIVFHPGGTLEPAVIDRLVAEQRFGKRTRALLQDVRSFPDQFERARAATPDTRVFLGFAPVNQVTNYGVARRFASVPWTLFYMVPEANVQALIWHQTRVQVALALAIILGASALGLFFARSIVRPVAALGAATSALTEGRLDARVSQVGGGELGRLAAGFNAMAERIQAQSAALQHSRDELEQRVTERTAELASTADQLRGEVSERRRAEAAIRESQELLQAIIDNTAAVIYVKDLRGRYTMVNRRYGEIFHLAEVDIVGRTDEELFPAETAAAVRAVDLRVAAGDAAVIAEETVPLDDGPHTYVSVKCPLRDVEGRVHGVFGISTDITDRKAAEERVAGQLARLRLLDEITTAIGERQDLASIYQVAVHNLEERLPVDFCCICRYDADEHPHRQAGETPQLPEGGMQSGKAPVGELTVLCVGTASRDLALSLAMTEQARVRIDQNGLSRCVRGELVYEADIETLDFPFPRRLTASGLRALVCAPLNSDSRVFGVLVAARREAASFSSSDCEFIRQLSAHVALAARQAELHGALQHAYDELRESQQLVLQHERLRALGQMASGIAHDINNAISPAALYTEDLLLHEKRLSERGRAQLETISRAIDDVAATVARMREFYRQQEPAEAMRPVDLNGLVKDVIDLTRARWSDMPLQRGVVIELRTELASGLPEVAGIASELREALTNLVFNAVDAMPDGGTLTLRTRYDRQRAAAVSPGRVLLEVGDTGIGMDQTTRQRCLEPFFTTKGERGTGLGLAMVYGVTQRHAADIEIDSVPGRGTTIRLVLPVADASQASLRPLAPEARPMKPLRLLLVDDDPVLMHSLSATLARDGHDVTLAAGGQAGIDLFNAAADEGNPYDVVFTDLGMPHVDGRKVAASVKARSGRTPVIMLTGWGRPLAAGSETPPHVDALLGKPPKMVDIRAALAQVTHSPHEPLTAAQEDA